jgi:hypothetical protein
MPVVEGEWWQIAGDDPDVSPFRIVSDGSSNTCDFTIYQDATGLWHAIACVRGTNAPGERVFHHWTSDSLTAEDWQPQGVLDWPRGNRLGKPTSVQAPHAFRHEGKYYCFYNSGNDGARAMVSDDGIRWSVFTNDAGQESIFSMGRDVNLFHDSRTQPLAGDLHRRLAGRRGSCHGLPHGLETGRALERSADTHQNRGQPGVTIPRTTRRALLPVPADGGVRLRSPNPFRQASP